MCLPCRKRAFVIFNLDHDVENRPAILAAIQRVVESGWVLGGDEIKGFEREWASYTDQAFAVGVGSGTDAIRLTLLALGIGPGDEVLTPAFNVAYTAIAIKSVGATPVFVDVDANYKVGAQAYWDAITPRTRAIVPVHLFGHVHRGNCEDIWKVAASRGLVVVEDAAQAHGALDVGMFAHAAAYSFYPTKNLGALGEAGAVTTNIPIVADRVRLLRDAGRTDRYVHELRGGTNTMLDEIQAAVLREKLPRLFGRNVKRKEAADYYAQEMPELPGPPRPTVNHLYVVRVKDRTGLRAKLTARDIPSLIHYPVPVPLQPIFIADSIDKGPWPRAEKYAREVLSLPLFPDITREEQNQVIEVVLEHTT